MNLTAADQIVAETFLDVRAKLLEIAATLDRVDRSLDDSEHPLGEEASNQRDKLADAIRILLSEGPDRAARLQHLFSRPYEPNWRDEMNL